MCPLVTSMFMTKHAAVVDIRQCIATTRFKAKVVRKLFAMEILVGSANAKLRQSNRIDQ